MISEVFLIIYILLFRFKLDWISTLRTLLIFFQNSIKAILNQRVLHLQLNLILHIIQYLFELWNTLILYLIYLKLLACLPASFLQSFILITGSILCCVYLLLKQVNFFLNFFSFIQRVIFFPFFK